MKHVVLVAVLMLTAACEWQSPGPSPLFVQQPQTQQPQPSPPPAPAPTVVSVREVTLGESIQGVYGDGRTINPGEHHFVLTARESGTAAITLTWDPWFVGTLLKLTVGGQTFQGAAPNWSPVVGRIPVEAGKTYLIVLSLAGADWLPEDPFVLTTALEP